MEEQNKKFDGEAKVKEYKKFEKEFKTKFPLMKDLKKFTLTHINVNSNPYIYKYKDITISHYHDTNLSSVNYPITPNDILSIFEYYGLLEKCNISIQHFIQKNIQGMVSFDTKKPNDNQSITLFIPDNKKWIFKRFKEIDTNDKYITTLCVLLHECSHALGNITTKENINEKCENEADRFALQESKKWIKIL